MATVVVAGPDDEADRAAGEGADHLAVTAKDRVRWPGDLTGRPPVPAVFDLDVRMEEEERFVDFVESRLPEGAP